MKFIATYLWLYFIPAIAFSEIKESDFREFIYGAFEEERQLMNSSRSPDEFFFHKGKTYAFMEIMRIIHDD